MEEAVERLDIVIVDSDPRLLLQLVKPVSLNIYASWLIRYSRKTFFQSRI